MKDQIYKDFEKLFLADEKKSQAKIKKSLEKDFEKLIQKEIEYEKSSIAKIRKKVSSTISKDLIKTRQIQKRVKNKKLDLDYKSFQKSFMLPTPLKMSKKLLTGHHFEKYLHENFYSLVYNFFIQPKFYFKNKHTLATIGYHFFFKRGEVKSYQSGFRKPRMRLSKTNVKKVISDLFKQTFDRFDVYFKTRGSSALYFEGLTTEISFDMKGGK